MPPARTAHAHAHASRLDAAPELTSARRSCSGRAHVRRTLDLYEADAMEQRSADRSRRSTLASACGGVRARREAAQRAAKERTCDGCTGCYGCGGWVLTRLQIAAASGAPPGRPSCGRGSRHACGRISRGCGQGRTRSKTKPEANILMTACVACGGVDVVWHSQRVARSATSSRSVLKRKKYCHQPWAHCPPVDPAHHTNIAK